MTRRNTRHKLRLEKIRATLNRRWPRRRPLLAAPRPPWDTLSQPLRLFRTLSVSHTGDISMYTDPAAAAWIVAGKPSVDAPPPVPGRCARCGTEGPTVTVSRILSDKFTGFEDWPYGWRRLCVPCAWAYDRRPTAQVPMLITRDTVTEYADGRGLVGVLTAGPLATTCAAVLPVRALLKRRYLLATAQWGHLAIDKLVLRWESSDAARLADLVWLRGAVGATWPQLSRDAPPAKLITGQPPEHWPRIINAWEQFASWRSTPMVWAAAREITDPPGDRPEPVRRRL